jgi:hypothetical protein
VPDAGAKYDGLEGFGGHGPEYVGVGFDVPGGRGDPGSKGGAVYQGDAAERHTLEQVGAKHRSAADVVTGDRGGFEVEGFYQLGRHAGPVRNGDVESFPAL